MTHGMMEAIVDATQGTGWFVLGYLGVVLVAVGRRHL